MKTEKWLTALTSAALTFAITFGGLSCMVTGLSLNAQLPLLALACGLFALVVCLCGAFEKLPVLLLTLLLGHFLPWDILIHSFRGLISRISYLYDLAYGWGRFTFAGVDPALTDMTPALAVAGSLLCLMIGWVLSTRLWALLAFPLGLTPLVFCLIVTDTVPQLPYLFLLMVGLVLLLLTQRVRRRDAKAGNRLTAMLALPVAAAVALLFLIIPQDGYTGQTRAQEWLAGLMELASRFQGQEGSGSLADSYGGGSAQQVSLSQLGPKIKLEYPVMYVTASYEDQIYLRGCSYDTYDGKTWRQTTLWEDPAGWPADGDMIGSLRLDLRTSHAMKYLPYYPAGQDWSLLENGRLEAPAGQLAFDYRVVEAGSGPLQIPDKGLKSFLQLPEGTRQAALSLLEEADIGHDPATAVSQIRDFVRQSATYDLNTRQMPATESDFVIWFLRSSDTGYCVHFASAATVLLRAVGIPARYVTGYTVSTVGASHSNLGYSATVTGGDAHAWVEYWTADKGWQVLEVTPPEPERPVPETTLASITTQPADTTAPSAPDVAPSSPDHTSGPTVPDEPLTDPDQKQEIPGWLMAVLTALAGIAGAGVLIWGQWRLRMAVKHRCMATGPTERQALARWREVERLCRILRREPEEALLSLAEKAKYSPQAPTDGELARFDATLAALRGELSHAPLRLVYRYVYAAW